MGASDYLVKPLDYNQIEMTLHRYVLDPEATEKDLGRVLIVDDDENARYIIRNALNHFNAVCTLFAPHFSRSRERKARSPALALRHVNRLLRGLIRTWRCNLRREPQMQEGRSKSTRMKTIHMAGAVIAVLTATLAVINTGYFDRYIVSSSQASAISGVLIYNK